MAVGTAATRRGVAVAVFALALAMLPLGPPRAEAAETEVWWSGTISASGTWDLTNTETDGSTYRTQGSWSYTVTHDSMYIWDGTFNYQETVTDNDVSTGTSSVGVVDAGGPLDEWDFGGGENYSGGPTADSLNPLIYSDADDTWRLRLPQANRQVHIDWTTTYADGRTDTPSYDNWWAVMPNLSEEGIGDAVTFTMPRAELQSGQPPVSQSASLIRTDEACPAEDGHTCVVDEWVTVEYQNINWFMGNQSQTLTVVKAGLGAGTVTSSPAGIDCGTTCSHTYAKDTAVTLTATPTSKSTFGGWSGACTGKTACVVTMDQARSVTATFNPIREPSTITLNFTNNPEIRANGQVTPNKAGQTVTILLHVERRGEWVRVGRKTPTLSAKSRYVVRFPRPSDWMCRLTARYGGDATHKPSSVVRKFSC